MHMNIVSDSVFRYLFWTYDTCNLQTFAATAATAHFEVLLPSTIRELAWNVSSKNRLAKKPLGLTHWTNTSILRASQAMNGWCLLHTSKLEAIEQLFTITCVHPTATNPSTPIVYHYSRPIALSAWLFFGFGCGLEWRLILCVTTGRECSRLLFPKTLPCGF